MDTPKPKKLKGGKSKKRKAESATSEGAPPEKKSKKSVVNEIGEQWQKYEKQTAPNNTRKKSAATTPQPKKDNKAQPKKSKKSNPLLKHREPCDLMRNEKRAKSLIDQMEVIEKISEDNYQQKALAVNVMPARERQNLTTLSITEDKANHMVFNDTEFSREMKRLNYERSVANGETGRSYPMQNLMGEQGFFSINNEHIDQVLTAIVDDKRIDIAASKRFIAENSRAAAAAQGKNGGGGGDSSNKKLNCIFGGILYSFGYTRRTPQVQYKKAKAHDIEDRARRFEEYYAHDQLESETLVGEYADNFTMFKAIKRQLMPEFLKRNETLRDTASLTSKTTMEVVSREYIAPFRQPPCEGEERCANQEDCVFYTCSDDKNAKYIGKVFYTENEKARLLKRQLSGDEPPEEGNKHLLCYECIIRKWTIEWMLNMHYERLPERPINYFTVMCKPGQYSPHCMLSQVENDKLTGIIGYVPRFSMNNLHVAIMERYVKRNGQDVLISVPVIQEIGMDF